MPALPGLNFDFFGVAPEPLQIVKAARLFGEYVNDERAVIDQNPFGVVVAFGVERARFDQLQFFDHGVGDRLGLARRIACAYDEVIRKFRDGRQPQYEDALGLLLFGGARGDRHLFKNQPIGA